MKSVLQLPENSPNYNPIAILQVCIDNFRDGVRAIDLASKHSDWRLIDQMMQNMRPMLLNLQNGDGIFRTWLDQTRKRMETFRGTLG
jgi:hypothetical protein